MFSLYSNDLLKYKNKKNMVPSLFIMKNAIYKEKNYSVEISRGVTKLKLVQKKRNQKFKNNIKLPFVQPAGLNDRRRGDNGIVPRLCRLGFYPWQVPPRQTGSGLPAND